MREEDRVFFGHRCLSLRLGQRLLCLDGSGDVWLIDTSLLDNAWLVWLLAADEALLELRENESLGRCRDERLLVNLGR